MELRLFCIYGDFEMDDSEYSGGTCEELYHLDLCAGIAGFTLAAEQAGFTTIGCAETDPFPAALIEEKLEIANFGALDDIACLEANHTFAKMIEERGDIVPCEETGFSSATFEDFMEGAIEMPDLITFGFPCQKYSSSNIEKRKKKKEGLEADSTFFKCMNIVEELDPNYFLAENVDEILTARFSADGAYQFWAMLERINKCGYDAEFGEIRAHAVRAPHARPRCWILGTSRSLGGMYGSEIHKAGGVARRGKFYARVIDAVADDLAEIQHQDYILPLPAQAESARLKTRIEDQLFPKYRQKRLFGLGNAVVPEIPRRLLDYVRDAIRNPLDRNAAIEMEQAGPRGVLYAVYDEKKGWQPADSTEQLSLFGDDATRDFERRMKPPRSGMMRNGKLYAFPAHPVLATSPPNCLWLTPTRADAKNNGNASRARRPGGMGGLNGQVGGAVCPSFVERLMMVPHDHTNLQNEEIYRHFAEAVKALSRYPAWEHMRKKKQKQV